MALTWDVSEVKDHATVTTLVQPDGHEEWHPVTQALVWLSLACGFNRITALDVDAVAERISAWEALNGCMVKLHTEEGTKDVRITRADVERHVGMRTNATKKSRARFERELGQDALKAAARRVAAERKGEPPPADA